MNKRILKYDNLRGILIYLVVIGHLLYSYNYYNTIGSSIIVQFIYSFHMPLFLIISGYFSKNINKNNIIKLFLVFILLNLSYILYDYIITSNLDFFSIKYSAWYLLAIVFYRLIVYFDKTKILNKNKTKILIILYLSSILVGFLNIYGIRFISFSFFFYFGYLVDFNKFKFNKNINLIALISSIIILISVSIFPLGLDFFTASVYVNFKYLFLRGLIYLTDLMLFISIYNLMPNKKIALLSKWGSNSLGIYVCHRIITLLITDNFILTDHFYIITFISSIFICILFSSNVVKNVLQNNVIVILISMMLIALIGFNYYHLNKVSFQKNSLISLDKSKELNNSISLGFVGDLILLENQVKNSYYNGEYNFDYMFKKISNNFNNTDYMFGVLEGPVDDTKDYSIGNFNDNKKLYLNYPSSFLTSIKKSGIDLVTIANNHILDKGVSSFNNTIKNLKRENLNYVGNYNERRKIVTIKDIKVGILAYTYGLNYYNEDELFTEGKNITNYIVDSSSKYFNQSKKEVISDFNYLKKQNVDLIVVLPHYGTQFNTKPDKEQKIWNKIFSDNGADIVFGTHSHIVQPVEYINDTIIFNSVGNFVNSYTEHNGDISIMAKVYINSKTKKIICGSVTPLLAIKDKSRGYYAVPVYNNKKNISVKKLNYANKFATKISIKKEINMDNAEEEYYYFKDGYKKHLKTQFTLTELDKNSVIYQKISENNNICFIGDSITEGTKNNYYPWYLPLINKFADKKIYNFSKGGYTSSDILMNYKTKLKNTSCDLVIMNIGTNDIRYNLTKKEKFINNVNTIINLLPNSDFILLSPFRATYKDIYLQTNALDKLQLYDEYDKELKKIADNKLNIDYIDVNNYIQKIMNIDGEDNFLLDGIHPNNTYGIELYSFATMR